MFFGMQKKSYVVTGVKNELKWLFPIFQKIFLLRLK